MSPDAKVKKAAYQRKWYAKNKERESLRSKKYHRTHKEQRNAASRAWWHRLSPEGRIAAKWRAKCRAYGITSDRYNEMLAAQSFHCACCSESGELAIDHDHVTGKVRGLLCHSCNLMLGHIENRESDWLARLTEYLEKHKETVE